MHLLQTGGLVSIITMLQILSYLFFDGWSFLILTFVVWYRSGHVLPCRPSGVTLDIKKSSYKKLSKWLQSKSSSGLVCLLMLLLLQFFARSCVSSTTLWIHVHDAQEYTSASAFQYTCKICIPSTKVLGSPKPCPLILHAACSQGTLDSQWVTTIFR